MDMKFETEVFEIEEPWLTTQIEVSDPQLHPSTKKSVVVLPFENLNRAEDHEYFCDGMTEELINALTKIRELKVTSRTSSFHYKGNRHQPKR